jgi:arylsulfatase
MEDPSHPNYPQALKDKVGPRNMVHSWATTVDDPDVMPRWGKIGKQIDRGRRHTLSPSA